MPSVSPNKEEARSVAGFKVTDDASLNREILEDYSSARGARYKDSVENDRFYHNEQYEEEEKARIIADGQAPISINASYAIVKQIIALVTGNRPVWDVTPVGDTDKQFAYLHRQLLYAMWYTSKGGRELESIIKDMCITGVGYGMVSPDIRTGIGAQFEHIPYHQVYVDPAIRKINFSDAESICVAKTVSDYQAARMLNMTVEELTPYLENNGSLPFLREQDVRYPRYMSPVARAKGSDGKSKDSTRKYVDIVQRMSMEKTDAYFVTPKEGKSVITRKVYFELTPLIQELEGRGLVKVEKRRIDVLAKYISVGDYCEKFYLPIDGYNITPFVDEFNGTPYALGTMDFLYGLQRALNKFILLTILNATLSNNMKMMGPKGSINKADYEENYATPGAYIEYEWTEGMPEPKQINPLAMSSDFFAFPQMLISIMEYLTGIFGVVQGNPEGAPRTASGLVSLQSYGGQKSKLLGRHIEDSLSECGDTAISLFQNYSGFNEVVTYYDEQQRNEQTLKYNQIKVNKDLSVSIENDLSVGKFRTRVTVRQDYGSERQAKASILTNLAAQTRSSALIPSILKLADIPEADEIVGQLDEMMKANQTIEQLQSNLQRMQQVNKSLEAEVMRKSKAVELAQFSAELDKLKNRLEKEVGIKAVKSVSDFENSINQLAMQAQSQNVSQTQPEGV